MRTVAALAAVALVVSGCGGPGSVDDHPEDDAGLKYVREHVGLDPADSGLWESEPLRGRLVESLGPRLDVFLDIMKSADPVGEADGLLYVTALRRDPAGLAATVLTIDPQADVLQVRLKINQVVQEFTEGDEPLPSLSAVDAFFEAFDAELFSERHDPERGGENEGVPAASPVGEVHRGFLVLGPQIREFLTCDTNRTARVENRSPDDLEAIRQHLGVEPNRPMFAEVRGMLGPALDDEVKQGFALRLVITEIRRAYPAGEGPLCGENLDFEFRATGNEPSWAVVIAEPVVRLSRPGHPELEFPYRAALHSGKRLRYVFTRQGDPGRLVIELEPRRCGDTMSGALFSWGAAARLGDLDLTGCAFRGR